MPSSFLMLGSSEVAITFIAQVKSEFEFSIWERGRGADPKGEGRCVLCILLQPIFPSSPSTSLPTLFSVMTLHHLLWHYLQNTPGELPAKRNSLHNWCLTHTNQNAFTSWYIINNSCVYYWFKNQERNTKLVLVVAGPKTLQRQIWPSCRPLQPQLT